MKRNVSILAGAFLAAACLAAPAHADSALIGGDLYVSGPSPSAAGSAGRDLFVAGFSPEITGTVAKDAHVSGFDVDVNGTIGGNLYAVGASVMLDGPVGEDLSASGFSIRVRDGARVDGNARLAGGSVKVDGSITGSLAVVGGSIKLNGPVGGDVRLTAGSIAFGDAAKIGGTLVYAAPGEIDIPESVIAADKVRFEQLTRPGRFAGWDRRSDRRWISFAAVFWGFVLTVGFLTAVGALFLWLMPFKVETLRLRVFDNAGLTLLAGATGLAMIIGLVPVSVMSLIALPLVPFLIPGIIIIWTLAYILGVYTVASRIMSAYTGPLTKTGWKIIALAAGLVTFAVLNFIPFIGWLINLAAVLFGLGAAVLTIVLPKASMAPPATPDEGAGTSEPAGTPSAPQGDTGPGPASGGTPATG